MASFFPTAEPAAEAPVADALQQQQKRLAQSRRCRKCAKPRPPAFRNQSEEEGIWRLRWRRSRRQSLLLGNRDANAVMSARRKTTRDDAEGLERASPIDARRKGEYKKGEKILRNK